MKRNTSLALILALACSGTAVLAQQQGGNRGGNQERRGGADRDAPAQPAPRNAHGRVILGSATSTQVGLWTPVFGIRDPIAPADEVPFKPWARALFDDRQKHELEPHARCKASGTARQFLTPYGVEIVELPQIQRIYIFDVGGPHTYRTIYMDGRTHPRGDLPPSSGYYGHSIGWWEGDTLFVETTGFNEGFWLDRRGLPHTEQMRTLEKFTRPDAATINYEITVVDKGAYTAPWTGRFNLRRQEGSELFEYVCQQSNYADDLMVGDNRGAVGATSTVIP